MIETFRNQNATKLQEDETFEALKKALITKLKHAYEDEVFTAFISQFTVQ